MPISLNIDLNTQRNSVDFATSNSQKDNNALLPKINSSSTQLIKTERESPKFINSISYKKMKSYFTHHRSQSQSFQTKTFA